MLAVALVAAAAACSDNLADARARADVEALAKIEGVGLEKVTARVAAHGRRAILHVETALHDASVEGRLNLIAALRRIGDAEAIPLLEHRALRDEDERVRVEAEFTLRKWLTGEGARAAAARRALRRIEEARRDESGG